MPLTLLQARIVSILKRFRSSSNYVGGGAALNQYWRRLSDDMDIYYERPSGLVPAAHRELAALEEAGLNVEVTVRQEGYTVEAIITSYGRGNQTSVVL